MPESSNFVGLQGLQVRPGIDNFAPLESYTQLINIFYNQHPFTSQLQTL